MSGDQLDKGLMASALVWPPPVKEARAAALTVVEQVDAPDERARVLAMLGLDEVLRG